MIFGLDDFNIVSRRGSTENADGTNGTRGGKLFILANSLFDTVSMLLESLKFTRGMRGQRIDGTVLLDNSKASSTVNTTSRGIDARITFCDCIIGGAVTVGVSTAILRLTFFLWNRFLVLNLRPSLKTSRATEHEIPDRSKRKDVQQVQNDDIHDDETNFEAHDQSRNFFEVTTDYDYDSSNSIIKGSCQCKAVQFLLRCNEELKRNYEGTKLLLSNNPLTDFDPAGKISFPRLPIHSASKYFELNPSSIPFFRIYHVAPMSSLLPSVATFDGTKHRTVNAAHAFCSICGVPILYAPDSTIDGIELNACCLDKDIIEDAGDVAAITQEMEWRGAWSETSTQNYYHREESCSPYDDDRTPYHPFKSISTPLTEVTTVTTASTAESSRTIVNDGSTNGSLDSDFSLCTALFDSGVNNVITPSGDVSTAWQGCGNQIHKQNSINSRWKNISDPVSNGDTVTTSMISSTESRLGNTSTLPLWKKYKRRSLIDSPVKQNLMHYMKKHLRYSDSTAVEISEATD